MADYATRSYSFNYADLDVDESPSDGAAFGLAIAAIMGNEDKQGRAFNDLGFDEETDNDDPTKNETNDIYRIPDSINTESALGLVANANFRKVGLDPKGNIATPIVKSAFRDSLNNFWNLMGDTSIEGQVIEEPTLEESLLTQSYGGWNIDNDPGDDDTKTQSHHQWAYGPGGGKSHYVANIPNGFKPIMQAKDDTYKPSMVAISTPKTASANGTTNSKDRSASATCPTVPDGDVFEKIVVRAWCKWQGPPGTQAYVKVRLPSGLEAASEIVTADEDGGIVNFEYTTTDLKNIGKAFSASWHSASAPYKNNSNFHATTVTKTIKVHVDTPTTSGTHGSSKRFGIWKVVAAKATINKPTILGPPKNFSEITTEIDGGITTTIYYRHDYYQEQPVTSPGSMKSVVIGSKMGKGMLYFSTFGHLFTCSAVWAFNTKTLVDDNLKGNRLKADDYRDMVNSVAVAGAAKMVYNMIMEAMSRRSKSQIAPLISAPTKETKHNSEDRSSTWSIVTPWHASWVIDGRNDVLNRHEIATNNFELLPKDLGANLLNHDDTYFEPTIGGWKPVNNSCLLESTDNLPATGVKCMKMTALTAAGASNVYFNRLIPNSAEATAGENVSRTRYGTAAIAGKDLMLITIFSEQLMGATPSENAPKIPTVYGDGIKAVQRQGTVRRTHSDRAKQFRVTTFSAIGNGTTASINIDFGEDVQVSCYWTVHEVHNANVVLQTTWGSGVSADPVLALDDIPTPDSSIYAVIHRYGDTDYNIGLPDTNSVSVQVGTIKSVAQVVSTSTIAAGRIHAYIGVEPIAVVARPVAPSLFVHATVAAGFIAALAVVQPVSLNIIAFQRITGVSPATVNAFARPVGPTVLATLATPAAPASVTILAPRIIVIATPNYGYIDATSYLTTIVVGCLVIPTQTAFVTPAITANQSTTITSSKISILTCIPYAGKVIGVFDTGTGRDIAPPIRIYANILAPTLTDDTWEEEKEGWIEDVDFVTRGVNRLQVVHRTDPQSNIMTWHESLGTDWAALMLELGYEEFGAAAAIAESSEFAVSPGKPYFVTAHVRRGVTTFTNAIGQKSSDTYDRRMRVGLRFYDANNKLISTKYAANQVFLHESMPIYGTAVDSRGCDFVTSAWWTQIGCTAKAPANATKATASVGYYPELDREWQFVDEVEVNCLDPEYVYQRRLSDKNYQTLIDEQIRGTDWEEKLIGLPRIYHLEVTNSNVLVPRKKAPEMFPYAWTEVYTPKFSVPQEIGPHVVREELTVGDYAHIDSVYKTYPPKPWSAQIRVIGPNAPINTQKFSWIARGICTASKKNVTSPTENPLSTSMLFNWSIHINENNSKFEFTPGVPYFGSRNQPWGIQIASELPHPQGMLSPVSLRTCWPSYGIFGVWRYGESSDVIKFVQQALNVLRINHKLSIKPIPENGKFDTVTKAAVQALIDEYGAKDHASDVVDSSTLIGPAILAVIGIQLLDLGPTRVGRTDGYFGAVFGAGGPNKFMLSDGVMTNRFMLTSSTEDVPPVITESFIFSFPKTFLISKVFVTAGDTPNQILQSIDLLDTDRMNTNAVKDGLPSALLSAVKPNKKLAPNQKTTIEVGPYEADQIIITIRQETDSINRSTVSGEAGTTDVVPAHKRIEIADISFEAIVPRSQWDTISQNSNTSVSQGTYTYQVKIQDAGQAEVTSDRDLNIRAQFKSSDAVNGIEYSNIVWQSVEVSNPDVKGLIASDGLMNFRMTSVYAAATDPASAGFSNYVFGPVLGQSSREIVYTMDEFGRKKSLPDTGWISKNDGIQLLCKYDGSPFGFTNIVPNRPFYPTDIGSIPSAKKAIKIRLERFNSDTSIVLAFYDKKSQEFITSVTGEPEISYDEYLRRGPSNVYVGLVANYETQRVEEVPYNDAPKLPQRWAMPVYGLVNKKATPISLAPISPNLSIDDIWPAAVRPGTFVRTVQIRKTNEGYLTNSLRDYQGTTVEAHYRVAESDNAGWSTIFGQPYRDIRNETPLILNDSHIQVRQAPMHAVVEPTPKYFNQLANPLRPTFRVSVRETYDDDWRILSLPEIEDYNLSTGDIFLVNPLKNADPNLVKVDYVTTNGLVYFKQFSGTLLNLNPYPGGRNSNQAIYIYIVPEYIKDMNGKIIPNSYTNETLRFTTNPNIFDYVKPEYDPLAHQLGVIYVNTALDSNDLIIVDARRRGGGVLDTIDGDEFLNVIRESVGYWDIGHSFGEAYQKGGFVIIRLPGELKERMTEKEIREVIDRTITSGVRYELQDLNGINWS